MRLMIIILFLLFSTSRFVAFAYDFEADDIYIYYNIVDKDKKLIEVTSGKDCYGDIEIPLTISVHSKPKCKICGEKK